MMSQPFAADSPGRGRHLVINCHPVCHPNWRNIIHLGRILVHFSKTGRTVIAGLTTLPLGFNGINCSIF